MYSKSNPERYTVTKKIQLMERYFFIHIQKTAGSSLRRHLLDIFDEKNLYPPKDMPGGMPDFLHAYLSGEQLVSLPPEEQAGYELFSGHMSFATSQLLSLNEPVRTFTILRDPVERTLSVLRQKKKIWLGLKKLHSKRFTMTPKSSRARF